MPYLYESRQHKRSGRESLDCAIALQELVDMGVENIITFDAHDPRVQNAIPLDGFETVTCAYQFIKNILRYGRDIKVDSKHLMVVSPDEGGMHALHLSWRTTSASIWECSTGAATTPPSSTAAIRSWLTNSSGQTWKARISSSRTT
jgi:phosphoribosylpyrophosphate synthetase